MVLLPRRVLLRSGSFRRQVYCVLGLRHDSQARSMNFWRESRRSPTCGTEARERAFLIAASREILLAQSWSPSAARAPLRRSTLVCRRSNVVWVGLGRVWPRWCTGWPTGRTWSLHGPEHVASAPEDACSACGQRSDFGLMSNSPSRHHRFCHCFGILN